jgi:hypothetical protein
MQRLRAPNIYRAAKIVAFPGRAGNHYSRRKFLKSIIAAAHQQSGRIQNFFSLCFVYL